MPRFNTIKNSFIAGELSPKLEGRTDLDQYAQGCKRLENFIPNKQGGVGRRPGTRYAKTTQGGLPARLIPFVYSKDEAYCMEFTQDEIQGINVADGTTSNFLSHLESETDLLNVGLTYDDLMEVQYTQSADVLYVVHDTIKPLRIRRTAANTFSEQKFDQSLPGFEYETVPYRDVNTTVITITPSATTGSGVNLTASSSIFSPLHKGAYWKIGSDGYFIITVYNSATSVSGSVLKTLAGTTATTDWAESAWNDYRGWPRTIAFYQNRLCYGGNRSQPDTIWYSYSGNFDRMTQTSGTLSDSSPMIRTLPSQQVNQIQWLSPGKTLVAGTLGAESVIKPASGGALSDTNYDANFETAHGSSFVQAKRFSYLLMFLQRSGRMVRELQFDFNSDSYVSDDLSSLADHVPGYQIGFPSKIVQMDFDESRTTLWCIDEWGGFFGVTRDKQLKIAAWHRHPLGGTSGSGLSPLVKSVCVIPSIGGINDDVWLCVQREIDGNTVYYLEVIGAEYGKATLDDVSAIANDAPYFMDCAKNYYTGIATTTITGLLYLRGETVQVIADGVVVSDKVVSVGGTITLDTAALNVTVGLAYTPYLQLQRLDSGSVLGSAQGSIHRIDRAVVRFYRTASAKIGSSDTTLETVDFRPASVALDAAIPLYTGDKTIDFQGDYDQEGYAVVTSSLPLPISVSCITLRGTTNEQ